MKDVLNQALEALQILVEAADDSDGCQYGTLGTRFVRDLAQPSIAALEAELAAPAQEPVAFKIGTRDAIYKDSTPLLSVAGLAFEDWFSRHPRACEIGVKQLARDSYAAGMGDPLVTYAVDRKPNLWRDAILDLLCVYGCDYDVNTPPLEILKSVVETAVAMAKDQGINEPVGEVVSMPGTPAFSMAVFETCKVSGGTKIYTQQPTIPAGMALVPVEPFKDFLENGYAAGIDEAILRTAYAQFIAAAQKEQP